MLGGIGLDLVAAIPTPHDQPNVGRGCIAQRHRRTGHEPISPSSASIVAVEAKHCHFVQISVREKNVFQYMVNCLQLKEWRIN
jgi:hypothetical protein